jgi:hypothetical protein
MIFLNLRKFPRGTFLEFGKRLMVDTYFQDAVIRRPGCAEAALLSGTGSRDRFLVLLPPMAVRARVSYELQSDSVGAGYSQHDQPIKPSDVLVRLSSLAESQWKIKLLQRWIGRVEEVKPYTFVTVVSDVTNPQNPPEEVEFDSSELSPDDLPLLVPGAVFYWSIGYQDTPGGQRQRVSVIRFARLPRLSQAAVNRAFEQADHLAALLKD